MRKTLAHLEVTSTWEGAIPAAPLLSPFEKCLGGVSGSVERVWAGAHWEHMETEDFRTHLSSTVVHECSSAHEWRGPAPSQLVCLELHWVALCSFWCPTPPRCVSLEPRRGAELTKGRQGLCWETGVAKVHPPGVLVSSGGGGRPQHAAAHRTLSTQWQIKGDIRGTIKFFFSHQ